MEITPRHQPSFSVVRVGLAGGESVKVEAGAMMATSAGVEMKGKMEGGVLKSLKRSVLGGESLFVTTYAAPASGGWVDVAANLPGDVVTVPVTPNGAVNIQRGSWLCSGDGVTIDTKWGGFKNLFGGEGGFVVHAHGDGPVVMSCYGALDRIELGPGEQLVLDAGHMVAYSDGLQFAMRTAGGGVVSAVKTAEGLVFEFTGPGWVMTQSRNPQGLLDWINANLPGQRA